MKVGKFSFKDNNKTFIIAELSANHNGSLETALKTIVAAKRAGADAIKLQTYTADTITIDCKNDKFRIKQGTIWDGEYFYDLYKKAYTPWEWHPKLFEVAKNEGLICFSSPFDFSAVDLLEGLETPAYKIASFEITDIPLIEYVAAKGKPVIISTGIARFDDIELAIDACKRKNNEQIILLKCTSSYPTPYAEANLLMIPELAARFNVLTGLSDHTMGIIAPVVAVALGARIIEKHFIIDRSIGGPDSSFSLNEKEFSDMVKAVRIAEQSVGSVEYNLSEEQVKSREFCRSLFVVSDISEGEQITARNIRSIRPGYGLHPKHYFEVLGKKAKVKLERGTPLNLDQLY